MSALTVEQFLFDGQQLTLSSGNNNNIAITHSIVAITSSQSDSKITGLIPHEDSSGVLLRLTNTTSNIVELPGNSSASTSGYRFVYTTGDVIRLRPGHVGYFSFVPTVGWRAAPQANPETAVVTTPSTGGGSPYNFTNSTLRNIVFHISGGLTVGITVTVEGTGMTENYAAGGISVIVRPGASIAITWVTAPTIRYYEI